MLAPLCPNCREPMSAVEHELGGVWSCLYCEGCWLSSRHIEALASSNGQPEAELVWRNVPSPAGACESELFCPVCEATAFAALEARGVLAHRCTRCRGTFFRRGALAALVPHAFTADREAPRIVGKTLGVALATDVGLSLVLSLFL